MNQPARVARFILLILLTQIALIVGNNPDLDYFLVTKLKFPPYWDPNLMEIYRWNKLVKQYGVEGATERFKK